MVLSLTETIKRQHFQIIGFGNLWVFFNKIYLLISCLRKFYYALGFAIAYAYSNFLCVKTKVFLLIFYLTFGVTGYGLIEFKLRSQQNTETHTATEARI